MDSRQFKEAAVAATNEIIKYTDHIQERPVKATVSPGYLRRLLPTNAPENGERWEDIRKDIEAKIMPGMTHWNSPGFMAYYPAPTSYPSILGEMYSAAFALSAFNWDCAPAATELEIHVMDWLGKMLSLPSGYLSGSRGGGMIQGSTSEAILTVMVAARERYLQQTTASLEGSSKTEAMLEKKMKLVALGSEAAHTCTAKAARIIGVRYRSVPVSMDQAFSLTVQGLERVLAECRKEGLEPFFLTATLGTTATCAVDRFDEIRPVVHDSLIWVHVDAAYAGNALVCEEYQYLTREFEAFSSFSMSMSKWLLVNLDACCLFVQDHSHLANALSMDAPYLRNTISRSEHAVDFRNLQIPLSHRFRALKIWFVMRTYGVNGFKAYIRKHIEISNTFHSLVKTRRDLFHVVVPPAFALVAISVVPHGSHGASEVCCEGGRSAENRLTKAVHALICQQGEIILTSTVVGGLFIIRIVSANPNSKDEYMRRAFTILVAAAEDVLSSGRVRTSRL